MFKYHFYFYFYRTIKLSSPKLSNITAVGCILVYAAVILLGLDYSTLPSSDTAFPTVCTVNITYKCNIKSMISYLSLCIYIYCIFRIIINLERCNTSVILYSKYKIELCITIKLNVF